MNQIEYDCENEFIAREEISLPRFVLNKAKQSASECCSSRGIWKIVQRRIPALRWIPRYKIADLVPDILAGLTTGIYSIPQGMSYSVLASLPPVYGLYASFFPPLIYFFFGSSKHSSCSLFSLLCIMVAKARTNILPDFDNGTTATEYKDLHDLTPISVTTSLCLLTGLIQLGMALARLDILVSYLSDAAICGLTFGAVIQAVLSQINGVLGTESHTIEGTFLHNYYKLYDICEHIGETNIATLIISIIVFTILLTSKYMIEARTIKKGVPFPTELIVIIVATILSHFCKFEERWKVKVVSEIKRGFSTPGIPRFDVMKYLIGNGISIAIVGFALTISFGKLFAKKHGYRVDPNQELLALGLSNAISSIFGVFPVCTSLSKTIVSEAAGARTQLTGMVSCVILLIAILWMGPLLEDLPVCILSCIVLVSLRSLLLKIFELPKLWRCSKLDVVIWVVTAIVTILWDIVEGLVAGIIIAILLVVTRTQWPRLYDLGVIDETQSDFREITRYGKATRLQVPIFRFDAPPIFTNIDIFKKKLRQIVDKLSEGNENGGYSCDLPQLKNWAPLILDCSTWIYTDSMGIEAVKDINEECLKSKVVILFANLRSSVCVQYHRAGLFSSMCDGQFYPSIRDALQIADRLKNDPTTMLNEDTCLSKFLSDLQKKMDDLSASNLKLPIFVARVNEIFLLRFVKVPGSDEKSSHLGSISSIEECDLS
ncbi:hypothetical protein WR25_22646 [Diploscapter pachys]|uniref:STAS domain-containing protein n=1 Tax=Diploscapter pachys TaxID=2018661 RepID=A0A2A2JB34_9BILA|nr:hypothetical protein WR25_22646 [Diploscapter pachys]